MLWIPADVRSAAYMVADLPSGDKKWWVGAEDSRGRLITAWSQHPDAPSILAQLKFIGTVHGLAGKVDETLAKGYLQEAKWVKKHKVWIDTTQTSSGAPPMPPEVPQAPAQILQEELIASVKLVGKASSPTEIVRLELCKGIDLATPAVRLDHYEHDHRDVMDYPIWQTVYDNAEAAEEAINAVIQNRQKIGYVVEEKDMSRIFNATLRQVFTLIVPNEQTLIWDF